MATDQVQIEIEEPPDVVWAKAGDFGGISDFMPGIESLRLEGDERLIEMFGMEIRERLLERDDECRSLTYSVVGGVPIERHRATVSVGPTGAGSLVTWAFDVEPDEMTPIFADTYRNALEALKATFS